MSLLRNIIKLTLIKVRGRIKFIVLLNGTIYTVNPDSPSAGALVITGNRITAVCKKDSETKKYIGGSTRVIDLKGRFVTPGIIDAHVHFNRAGALINDANLMTVSDEEGLILR